MFEKYSDEAINARGGGGEYAVVEGFGWTNGVLIWAAVSKMEFVVREWRLTIKQDVFGQQLTTPDCGNITAAHTENAKRSAVELHRRDAEFVKRWT
jgi:alpha,alpha-trehalase